MSKIYFYILLLFLFFCGREKVHIPENKPYIFLRGNGRGRTHIVWSQSSSDNVESATFKVESPHFIAFGISFKVHNNFSFNFSLYFD